MSIASAVVPDLSTRVKLFRDPKGRLLGMADLVIGSSFVIKGIRILAGKGEDGGAGSAFISFPSRKKADSEEYLDIAHPVTAEAYRAARDAVLAAYDRAAAKDRLSS